MTSDAGAIALPKTGLVAGFVTEHRSHERRFSVVLIVPMVVAALEIIVNTARFDVGAMAPGRKTPRARRFGDSGVVRW